MDREVRSTIEVDTSAVELTRLANIQLKESVCDGLYPADPASLASWCHPGSLVSLKPTPRKRVLLCEVRRRKSRRITVLGHAPDRTPDPLASIVLVVPPEIYRILLLQTQIPNIHFSRAARTVRSRK
jgi:hypothetical protein